MKNQSKYKIFIFFILFYVVFLLVDIVIHLQHINILFINNIIENTRKISEILLVVIVTVLGFLVAVHYVVFQVFRNRFPLKYLREVLVEEINYCAKHLFLIFIVAMLFIISKYDFTLSIIPYVSHIFFCLFYFINSIKNFAKMDNTILLDEYKKDVILSIKRKPLDVANLKRQINKINQLNEDSFSKQEIAVCYYNLNICEELNKHFIKERDGLVISGNSEEELKLINDIFFSSILNSMRIAKTHKNDQYIEKAVSSLYKILKTCIECDKYNMFEALTDELNDYFSYNQVRNNIKPCLKILDLYNNLFDHVISNNKRDEWIELFKNLFRIYTLKSTIHIEDTIIKALCSSYFRSLEKLSEKDMLKYYEEHLDNLVSFIYQIVKDKTNSVDKYVQVILAAHTKMLIDRNDERYIIIFSRRIIKLCKFSIKYNYENLYFFLIIIIDNIIDEYHNDKIVQSLNETKFDLAIKVLNSENEITNVSLPNYQEQLDKVNYEIRTLTDIIEEFRVMFHRVLLKKDVGVLLLLLDRYINIINTLNQQQRKQQEELFKLFDSILHYSISINNREGFYVILDEFTETIESLDKENKISKGIINYCIELFSEMFSRCVRERHNELIFSCMGRVIHLHKSLNIVNRSTELQKSIIETLFQAGLDAIENHNEDIIRNVSNHLGWVGENAIKNSNSEILKFVLTKATTMYNISLDLEVNNKTVIFIGTLFIILGGCISANKPAFLPLIRSHMNLLKDKSLLYKSRNLRLYESNNWNDIMNGNAKYHIEKFSKIILEKSLNA